MSDWIAVHLLSPTGRHGFRARWRPPGSPTYKRKGLRTFDPEQAERLRVKLEYELNHGTHQDGAALTWRELRDAYGRERLAGRRKATRAKAGFVFDRFEALSKPGAAAAIDERAVSAHALRLRRSGLLAVTVAGHLAYLGACLRWAARQRLIPRAPAVEMPRAPQTVKVRTLDAAGLAALLAACPSAAWRLLVLVAWHTGLRRSELSALTWDGAGGTPRVDLDAKRVWLPACWTKADADQWVPLHADLLAHLAAARREAGRVLEVPPRSLNQLSRAFGGIARAAGLRITLHDLRRSFGSRYAPLVPAPVLQRLMRHADIRTTLRYYVDLDTALDDAINLG